MFFKIFFSCQPWCAKFKISLQLFSWEKKSPITFEKLNWTLTLWHGEYFDSHFITVIVVVFYYLHIVMEKCNFLSTAIFVRNFCHKFSFFNQFIHPHHHHHHHILAAKFQLTWQRFFADNPYIKSSEPLKKWIFL